MAKGSYILTFLGYLWLIIKWPLQKLFQGISWVWKKIPVPIRKLFRRVWKIIGWITVIPILIANAILIGLSVLFNKKITVGYLAVLPIVVNKLSAKKAQSSHAQELDEEDLNEEIDM